MTVPTARLRWLPLLALLGPGLAPAFVTTISSGQRAVYLRVGDGDFSNRPYSNNGSPVSGTTGARNAVTVAVPAASVGNGVAQAFDANSRTTSDWDGYAFCDAGETYIGGFSRGNGSAADAVLTATVTAPLSNGSQTIPFSKISWTATGNGDLGTQPIPSGAFSDTSRVLAVFPVNTWRESCHRFAYANDAVVAAGTYSGTVTYTLAAP